MTQLNYVEKLIPASLLNLQINYPVVHERYIMYVENGQSKPGYEVEGKKVILEVEEISKQFAVEFKSKNLELFNK